MALTTLGRVALYLSELVIFYVTCFGYFLQVHVINVRQAVHEEVLVLSLNLYAFVNFAFDLDDLVLALAKDTAFVRVDA